MLPLQPSQPHLNHIGLAVPASVDTRTFSLHFHDATTPHVTSRRRNAGRTRQASESIIEWPPQLRILPRYHLGEISSGTNQQVLLVLDPHSRHPTPSRGDRRQARGALSRILVR